MKKQILLLGIVIIGAIFLVQEPLFADSYELKEWWITLETLEISKDGGANWFTIFEGNTAPMSMIGQPAAPIGDKAVPAGTYNAYRVYVIYNKFVVSYNDEEHGTSNIYSYDAGDYYVEDTDESTETGDMTCRIDTNGTTKAYIDFDPEAAITVCTAVWDGSKYMLTDFDYDPVVTVHE